MCTCIRAVPALWYLALVRVNKGCISFLPCFVCCLRTCNTEAGMRHALLLLLDLMQLPVYFILLSYGLAREPPELPIEPLKI